MEDSNLINVEELQEKLDANQINLVVVRNEGKIFFTKKPEVMFVNEEIKFTWPKINELVKKFISIKHYVGLINFSKFELRVKTV